MSDDAWKFFAYTDYLQDSRHLKKCTILEVKQVKDLEYPNPWLSHCGLVMPYGIIELGQH